MTPSLYSFLIMEVCPQVPAPICQPPAPHLRQEKDGFMKGGIRVPLIIKMPGKTKPGLKTKQPVLSTDLYPTILDLLDLPLIPDQHRDGLKLKKYFKW